MKRANLNFRGTVFIKRKGLTNTVQQCVLTEPKLNQPVLSIIFTEPLLQFAVAHHLWIVSFYRNFCSMQPRLDRLHTLQSF